MPTRQFYSFAAATTAVCCVLMIAACGSSRPTTTTSAGTDRAQGIEFAGCMRSHGLADFPDPVPGHSMQFSLPSGLTPRSPAFRSAQSACRHLAVPRQGPGGGGISAGERSADLKRAQCMRAHGVPSYPDPTYRNGRPTAQPLTDYGINPDSPAVQSAERVCGGS
jgi:hypothetical protein